MLEESGTEDDDDSEVPKTPEALGNTVVRTCSDGLCEEGMHIGGLYCCSGGGYSGRYLNGTIDELRIWTRAVGLKELQENMYKPLSAGEEPGLLFYFPLDEAGMETGANVIESRALPWYAILGNAKGGGRPSWTVSSAPLSCTRGNRAPICRRLAGEDVPAAAASPLLASAVGSTSSASDLAWRPGIHATNDGDVSPGTVFLFILITAIGSAAVAATFTYASLRGELPPIVSDLTANAHALGRKLSGHDGYAPTAGPSGSFSSASAPQPHDWRWASPQRPDQQPAQSGAGAGATPVTGGGIPPVADAAPPKRSYGGV